MQLESLIASRDGLTRSTETDRTGGVTPLLRLLAAACGPIRPGAAILDFGCGVGNGVTTLLSRGYDAHGVDIFEYWGRHADLYWEVNPTPPTPTLTSRLRVATIAPYRLPFDDASFDHVISAEVLEHVADRAAVFGEISRVLRPGGTSVHIFPGRWNPIIEGHIDLPFPVLCKNHGYLKTAARLGLKSSVQRGMDWREVYRANKAQMSHTHYPTRRAILREAEAAGLRARFARDDYVAGSGTGWTRLYRRLGRFGLGAVALAAGRIKLEHMLVLARPGDSPRAQAGM